MTLDLFHQFLTPHLLGVPLLLTALLAPMMFSYTPPNVALNRLTALKTQLFFSATKHFSTPLSYTGHAWSLPLTMIFIYLLHINLFGLLPYTFTPTAQLATTMALSLPLWLNTVLMGLRNQPTLALAHFLPPGTPNPLIPILILIETISLFIRPVALGVRLTANLTAGHLLISLTSMALTALAHFSPLLFLPPMFLFILLFALEIAVAMIQAYVFVLLLSLYLQENT